MKKIVSFLIICISIIIVGSCAPLEGPAIPGTGPDPESEVIDLVISTGDATFPSKCIKGSGDFSVNFYITLDNIGRAIEPENDPDTPELISICLLSSSTYYSTYEEIRDNSTSCEILKSDVILNGYAHDTMQVFQYNSILFGTDTTGVRYYYALINISDKSVELMDDTPENNFFYFGSCESIDVIHKNWETAVLPSGSKETPTNVLEFEKWYSNTLVNSFTWYSFPAEISHTYDIYIDNAVEGSGTYDSSVNVILYHPNLDPYYQSTMSAFFLPLTVIAEDTSILFAVSGDGSYAFGIHKVE